MFNPHFHISPPGPSCRGSSLNIDGCDVGWKAVPGGYGPHTFSGEF